MPSSSKCRRLASNLYQEWKKIEPNGAPNGDDEHRYFANLQNAIYKLNIFSFTRLFPVWLRFATNHLSMFHRAKEPAASTLIPTKLSAILLFVFLLAATADMLTGVNLGGGV